LPFKVWSEQHVVVAHHFSAPLKVVVSQTHTIKRTVQHRWRGYDIPTLARGNEKIDFT
jgi:hypothetical protein